jgi:hypothetical protein
MSRRASLAPRACSSLALAARRPSVRRGAPRRPRHELGEADTADAQGRAGSQAAGAQAASLSELLARLGKLELAGLAGRLVTGWRTDLETTVEANRMSYAVLQDMVGRGREVAQPKERIGEMQAVAKVMSVIGPKDRRARSRRPGAGQRGKGLADVRELAEAAAKSPREAFDLVYRRVSRQHRGRAAPAAQIKERWR